jgi:putative FmdB family regulatory protein
MPIYEFHCDDCSTSFETLVRPGHDEDAQCPSCAGVRLNRELSVFASGRTQNGDSMPAPGAAMPRGGGCCGGGCGCH